MTQQLSSERPSRLREYSIVVSTRGFAFFGFFVLATLIAVMVVLRAAQVFVLLGAATTVAVIAAPLVRSQRQLHPAGQAFDTPAP